MSFFDIFLHAKKDIATGGRCPPNAAGKNAKQKDHAPGGPTEKRMPVKTRNKTITPPEGVGIAEWLVKTYYPKQTQNGQTPPVCPFAFILRQHRTIASATFSGAFTLEIRYFFLKYTKYSCEKLPFSIAKSPAECSCRIMWYYLVFVPFPRLRLIWGTERKTRKM